MPKTLIIYHKEDNDDDFDCGAYLRQKYNGGGRKGGRKLHNNRRKVYRHTSKKGV